MNLWEAANVPTSRRARFNEIVTVLVRHDLYGLLRQASAGKGGEDAPQRLRLILEELGPSFIKIGQLLATRPDLVPGPFVDEFKKLYDQTTPSPYDEVREVIKTELGKEIEELFSEFSPNALASASIGQVHKARLKDGTLVAVKVQHVGIEERVLTDFEILRGIVAFIESTFAATRVWQPLSHLDELKSMLERELDYRVEMRNTQKVAKRFQADPTVHVPTMFTPMCSRRVLVMEFIEGIKFGTMQDPRLATIDLKSVAKVVTHAMARQIFVHRLFHADPSPGNLMILKSDRVAFLDFGAVGIVTERRARSILRLITSVARRSVEGTADAIAELCDQRGELDRRAFETDVERILDFVEREDVSVADPRLLEHILNLAKRHRMLLPPDFVLITRALYQFEGFCRVLDPDYNLVEVLEPIVGEVLWGRIASPGKQKELIEDTVVEGMRLLRDLPSALNGLITKLDRSEFTTRVDLVGLEGWKASQGRATLKMAFTVMLGALMIGLGLLYAGPDPDARVGRYLFAAGGILAVWVIVMILWSESFKGNRE